MDHNFFSKEGHTRFILILLVLSYFFLMFGNGIVSLTHPDEVFYVQTAKEMIQHKSWLVPYIFDGPQFEKPILFYWLLAGAIKEFGVSPFVARFWPSFFGILGVITTYWLAFMLFQNKRVAFFSGLILSSSFIYLALSRAVLTDMVFSILVVISLAFFYLGYTNSKWKNVGIIFCFIFSALAVLAKGVLGLLLPGLVVLAYLFYRKDLKFIKSWTFLLGMILFLLIAVPWHIYIYRLFGKEFIDEYVFNVHIRRIFDAEHPKSDTWHFYPLMMFGGIFPWSLYLIPGIALWFKELRNRSAKKDQIIFLSLVIGVVFMIMQVAHSKLASYIFPVFPAIAILLGYYLEKTSLAHPTKGWKFISYLLAFLLLGLAVGAIFASQRYKALIPNMNVVYLFSVLGIFCSFLISFFIRGNKHLATTLSVPGITVIVLITLFLGHPMAEPWVSCKDICDRFNMMDKSDSTVLSAKFYVRGVKFYTDRKTAVIDINGNGFFSPHPIPFLNTDQKVLNFLNGQSLTYGIVKESNVVDLNRITKGLFKITFFEKIGGKQILKIEKL